MGSMTLCAYNAASHFTPIYMPGACPDCYGGPSGAHGWPLYRTRVPMCLRNPALTALVALQELTEAPGGRASCEACTLCCIASHHNLHA